MRSVFLLTLNVEWSMSMESFVNREAALKYIDDAFIMLQDKKRLLRTPIMDFYGVKGIGKTLFLKKCNNVAWMNN